MPFKSDSARSEYQRRYRVANRAKRVAGRPDYDRARHANLRAASYGVAGRITVQDVRTVLAAGRCFYCAATERLTIDHKTPMHIGGANAIENLVACCFSCNSSKFRSDRPGRWSRERDNCARCGTSSRKHSARGLCNACYIACHKPRRASNGDSARD